MTALLVRVLGWMLAGLVARVFVGAGLTFIAFSGINLVVETLLDNARIALGSLPADGLQIALLLGVGEALTLIGSALMTRAAIIALGRVLGIASSS